MNLSEHSFLTDILFDFICYKSQLNCRGTKRFLNYLNIPSLVFLLLKQMNRLKLCRSYGSLLKECLLLFVADQDLQSRCKLNPVWKHLLYGQIKLHHGENENLTFLKCLIALFLVKKLKYFAWNCQLLITYC